MQYVTCIIFVTMDKTDIITQNQKTDDVIVFLHTHFEMYAKSYQNKHSYLRS